MSVYVIAEAGVNHNGSLSLALKLADEAKRAGADCVKYQTFVSELLVSKDAHKADYQIENTNNGDSQYSMLKALELSFDDFNVIKSHCDDIGIDFMSTAFDSKSIDFLDSLGISAWKIPSGEITNLPYLQKISRFGKPIIMSTGMCSIDEVRDSVTVLRENGAADITLLHCTTEYPAPLNEINLNAITTLRNEFNLPVGYSDHTDTIYVPSLAVALGATVIEKHFTLDRGMEGPDHRASLEPESLSEMIKMIRIAERTLGDGNKEPSLSEKKNITVARKSIVAKTAIKKGSLFTEENLTIKRPGDGISPMKWYDILGKTAEHDYMPDERITFG